MSGKNVVPIRPSRLGSFDSYVMDRQIEDEERLEKAEGDCSRLATFLGKSTEKRFISKFSLEMRKQRKIRDDLCIKVNGDPREP